MFGRIALVLACVLAPFAASAEDIPAEPKRKDAPDFPVSCYPGSDIDVVSHRVDVAFDISRDGLTENVRIMQSTDPCFEEASLSAIRSWTYEPRMVDGRSRPQMEMEATFIFDFKLVDAPDEPDGKTPETGARALVFDAKPLKRVPPDFPDKCQSRAHNKESVLVEFAVDKDGNTKDIVVVESTNHCFDSEARKSVRRWKYHPKTIDGEPVERLGVQTRIVFQLDGANRVRPEETVRRGIASRLNKARRKLMREEDPIEVLADLKKLEEEYGDSLSPAELAAFHRVRGLARLSAKDYQGALDDFYVVRRLGSVQERDSVGGLIAQLEQALGVVNDDESAEPEASGDDKN